MLEGKGIEHDVVIRKGERREARRKIIMAGEGRIRKALQEKGVEDHEEGVKREGKE